MPNWCRNTLVVAGPHAAVRSLLVQVADPQEGTHLSLEKIVPIPPASSTAWSVLWGCDRDVDCPAPHLVMGPELTSVTFTFPSAWDAPIPALSALAAQHPDVHQTLVYSEPGESFAGVLTWEPGRVEGPLKEPAHVANLAEVHPRGAPLNTMVVDLRPTGESPTDADALLEMLTVHVADDLGDSGALVLGASPQRERYLEHVGAGVGAVPLHQDASWVHPTIGGVLEAVAADRDGHVVRTWWVDECPHGWASMALFHELRVALGAAAATLDSRPSDQQVRLLGLAVSMATDCGPDDHRTTTLARELAARPDSGAALRVLLNARGSHSELGELVRATLRAAAR